MRECRQDQVLPPSYWTDRHYLPDIVRLWMLRILVPLEGHRDFFNRYGFESDQVAFSFGWDDHITMDPDEFKHARIAVMAI